jgi:hypothetical protein
MTEEECIRRLPVLATWQAEARAQFVAGISELNGMAISGPPEELIDAVGVIVLGPEGYVAHYVPRATVVAAAESEFDFPSAALAALRKPPPGGELQVLVIGGRTLRMLIGIPGRMVQVSKPGSEGN